MKVEDIISIVSRVTGTREKEIVGECRENRVFNARIIVTRLCVVDGHSQSEIGRQINKRPCSIHYEVVKFKDFYETDIIFKRLYDECEKEYFKLKEEKDE